MGCMILSSQCIIDLVVIAGLIQQGHATNFAQCFQNLNSTLANNSNITLDSSLGYGSQLNLSAPNTSAGTLGLTDGHGNLVNTTSQAVGISYDLCVAYCGAEQEPFQWSIFSQQFNAWLLPWLALVSQLPFGARDDLDNFTSVVLAIGSPALAAYSLALTVLNGRWVARRFSGISYPSSQHAPRIMNNLQQMPLRLSNRGSLLASLIVLQENDRWWESLAEGLDYMDTWSIASVAQIAWVVIAYLFTVIDSLSTPAADIYANGQAVGSLWLWLLPVVIGWLKVSPKCDWRRVVRAVNRANDIAYVARSDCSLPIKLQDDDSLEERALTIDFDSEDAAPRGDERCSAPIFNYARFFPWTQMVEDISAAFRSAANNLRKRRPVDPSLSWRNRSGNAAQVDAYCSVPSYVRRSHWDSEVLSRFLLASCLALMLQWSSTVSAIIIVWFTPSIGLGCRSGSYIIYAVASTVVWILLVISSVLTHYSSSRHRSPTFPQPDDGAENRSFIVEEISIATHSHDTITVLAVVFRRLGKGLAVCNTCWIIIVCILQFSNVYDRCYCNSNYIRLGGHAYDIIVLSSSAVSSMKDVWIGAVALALGSATGFVGFIVLLMNPSFSKL